MKKIIVAIDGFSSCGKSTMAQRLARTVGYTYIDSGAMYRAVTYLALEVGLFSGDNVDKTRLKKFLADATIEFRIDHSGRTMTFLDGRDVEQNIRDMAVSSRVSLISAIDFVRTAMVKRQRELGRDKGIVMDGRDIGTTVFPNAELKIFITASPEIRAQRRYEEVKARGGRSTYEEVLQNVRKRDELDQTREVSPLRRADDAILLDNSHMSLEEQDAWMLEQFRRATESEA